ncbi:MAG TPA: hypothetical protein VMR08_00570 [Patescibacteria group bacterium]|jgi:hypothetical protein|nr:hypothetical protein [Patescibacteria group bacterium]
MYRYSITESPKGYEVYVNLITSSAGRYISRQPYLINMIKEVLVPMKLTGAEISIEHDMGRVIGNTDIVATGEKDVIFYAQPYKKTVFSRYVKNHSQLPSKTLTILLVQDENGDYELTDTWIGPCSPPFPGDKKETSRSKSYWETHALVLDTQTIQSKTLTKVCPY